MKLGPEKVQIVGTFLDQQGDHGRPTLVKITIKGAVCTPDKVSAEVLRLSRSTGILESGDRYYPIQAAIFYSTKPVA